MSGREGCESKAVETTAVGHGAGGNSTLGHQGVGPPQMPTATKPENPSEGRTFSECLLI